MIIEYATTRPFLRSYQENYNTLKDLDEAHVELVARKTHKKAIRKALAIISTGHAKHFLGISLLHRHFMCEKNTIFVERRVTPRASAHAPVLVTAPQVAESAPTRMAAHRFAIIDGALQPLEFTTDRIAISGYDQLARNTSLQDDLTSYISECGLASLLGVAVYARSPAVFGATQVFLEETRFGDRASVTHVLPRLPEVIGRVIPAVWYMNGGGIENGGRVHAGLCQAYCSHPKVGLGYCGHRKTPIVA